MIILALAGKPSNLRIDVDYSYATLVEKQLTGHTGKFEGLSVSRFHELNRKLSERLGGSTATLSQLDVVYSVWGRRVESAEFFKNIR